MRFLVFSDLHLEFAAFQCPTVEADAVIVAGDVHTGRNGLKWLLENITEIPVIYILGNHEFYGQTHEKLLQTVRGMAAGTNVQILENSTATFGNVVILGATFWTDFELQGDGLRAQAAAQTGMSDFKRIRTLPSYRRFRPQDARFLHLMSKQWIAEESAKHSGKRIIVVTHHAPSAKSLPPEFNASSLNPAYASNLEQFIEQSDISVWIHGHIHAPSNYLIGKTRVIANPRGYPNETTAMGFQQDLVIEV